MQLARPGVAETEDDEDDVSKLYMSSNLNSRRPHLKRTSLVQRSRASILLDLAFQNLPFRVDAMELSCVSSV